MPPGGRRAGIQCRLCVDQTCGVLVGQIKGWGDWEPSRSLSLWAQEQFLQPNWHLFPPSPAGPASAPCSTEPPTGTTCTHTQKHWWHCSSSILKMQKHAFVSCWLPYFSISGAQCTKSWLQNLKAGFLISSMKVMSRPHGCGLFTISLSSRTLQDTWVSQGYSYTKVSFENTHELKLN